MIKNFKIEIDCAVCASKVEDAIKKIDGVNSASVNFISQKMILDLDYSRYDEIMKKIRKTAKKIEPDFEIVE